MLKVLVKVKVLLWSRVWVEVSVRVRDRLRGSG